MRAASCCILKNPSSNDANRWSSEVNIPDRFLICPKSCPTLPNTKRLCHRPWQISAYSFSSSWAESADGMLTWWIVYHLIFLIGWSVSWSATLLQESEYPLISTVSTWVQLYSNGIPMFHSHGIPVVHRIDFLQPPATWSWQQSLTSFWASSAAAATAARAHRCCWASKPLRMILQESLHPSDPFRPSKLKTQNVFLCVLWAWCSVGLSQYNTYLDKL